MNASSLDSRALHLVRFSQFGAAAALRLSGWLCVTLLASFGVIAFLAFAIGNFTVDGTMLQLDNLASRYIDADGSRQGQFQHYLLIVWAIALTVIGFFRRGSLAQAIRDSEKKDG